MSPAFPLGSFAYSHGIETAISEGLITDPDTLEAWVRVILTRGSGWNDAILLSQARSGGDLRDMARALASSKERLEESEAQGAAFAKTVVAFGQSVPEGPLPVVVGEASRALVLDTHQVCALYLQSFAGNLVNCAVRFVPLGQTNGQRVLNAFAPIIADVAHSAAIASLDDIRGGAFGADLAAMRHETQTARMFLS